MAERRTRRRPHPTIESPYAVMEATRPPPRERRSRPRRRKSEMSNTARILSALFTLAFIGMGGTAFGVIWFEQSATSNGPLAETRPFEVKPREGPRTIAARLRTTGAISSENLFVARFMSRAALHQFETGKKLFLKAGRYEIPAAASIDDIIDILNRGRSVPSFLTFPEGWTTHAIVQRLLADPRLKGDILQLPAEGSLLPATFDIRPGTERQTIIDRMSEAMQKTLAELWATRAPNLPIKTPEEAVILASIVQREMGPKDNPARIASVFINRLRKGMRLESDPTILYGVHGREVDWSKPIFRSQIRKPSAHNTYVIKGLPPTPICNPGREAIAAVLQPAETNDLYFVANGKGGHFFATDLKGHNENVAKWRKIWKEIVARRKERAAEKAKQEKLAGTPNAPANGSVTSRQVPTVAIVNPKPGTNQTQSSGVPLPARRPNRRR